jgi:hypothetical protein
MQHKVVVDVLALDRNLGQPIGGSSALGAEWFSLQGNAQNWDLLRSYTPTGNGLGLDSSVLASGLRQRSKRPCNRLIRPVYQ